MGQPLCLQKGFQVQPPHPAAMHMAIASIRTCKVNSNAVHLLHTATLCLIHAAPDPCCAWSMLIVYFSLDQICKFRCLWTMDRIHANMTMGAKEIANANSCCCHLTHTSAASAHVAGVELKKDAGHER